MSEKTSSIKDFPTIHPSVISPANSECCICYDNIENTNVCITPCGHAFCFNCMVRSLKVKSLCPVCRGELDESPNNTEEEEQEEYDVNYDETIDIDVDIERTISSSDTESDDEIDVEVELLVDEFQSNGYDLKDAISLLLSRYSKTDPKYTKEYIDTLEETVHHFYARLHDEYCERRLMTFEDKNV